MKLRERPTNITTRDEAQRTHTIRVLQLLNGNRTHTARALGISLNTLQRDLRRWGVQDRRACGARY